MGGLLFVFFSVLFTFGMDFHFGGFFVVSFFCMKLLFKKLVSCYSSYT